MRNIESFPEPMLTEERLPIDERLDTGKDIYNFLNRTGYLDIRKSDERFEDWLQNISYEDFLDYITRLNGILRETPIRQRSIDGSDVEVSYSMLADEGVSYLPPIVEHKGTLLFDAFDAIKSISDNEDRALLAYYCLQAIHPYSDGNGRTGRLLYELISSSGQELTEDKLSQLLDHDTSGQAGTGNGRNAFAQKVLEPERAYYYVNREVAKEVFGEGFLQDYGNIFYSGPVGVGNVSEKLNLSQEERMLTEKIIGEAFVKNFSFRGLVILKLLQENGKLSDYQFNVKRRTMEGEVVPEDVGKVILGIDGEKFEAELTENDSRQMIEIHKDIKSIFVRSMIDIFKNPNAHLLSDEVGNKTALKNVFSLN